jgi:hypothetical protein
MQNNRIELDSLPGGQMVVEFGILEDVGILSDGNMKGLKDVKLLEEGTYYRRRLRINEETFEIEEFTEELDLGKHVLDAIAKNFEVDKERKQYRPIDYNHDMNSGQFAESRIANKSAGWVKDLKRREKDLLASSDFTQEARQHIESDEYKYASITFDPDWLDPITGERVGPKMLSYALTNTPFMENLGPIELSRNNDQSELICFHKELPNCTEEIEMSNKVVELSQELGKLEADISGYKAEVVELKAQLDKKEELTNSFEAERKASEEKFSAKEAELTQLTAKHETLVENHNVLLAAQKDLNDRNIELQVEQDFKAGKFSSVPEKEAMLELAKFNKEQYDKIVAARGNKVDLGESGTDAGNDVDEVIDFSRAVEKIQKDTDCSYDEAIDKAMKDHHDLYVSHMASVSSAN